MNHEIKPLELLFLWRLAVAGGGDWLKDIKPDPESPARKEAASRWCDRTREAEVSVWTWHRALRIAHRQGMGLAG